MSLSTLSERREVSKGLVGLNEWADQELIAHMRASAAFNGGAASAPRYDIYREAHPAAPTRATIIARFGGTWNSAMRAAGLPTNARRGRHLGGGRFTPEVCCEALRACAAEVGRPPTVLEYDAFKTGRTDVPCNAHIRRQLGGWIDALEAAGLYPKAAA